MASLATGFGRIHFEDEGTGPPVLLVHGWSLSSRVFGREVRHLARTRRVVAPDLRGHGLSSPAGPFTLADLATDLADLAAGLALERVVLAGWSLGAMVALAAVPFLGERLAGLVLVSGTPRFVVAEGWPHGLPAQSVEVLAHRVRRDPARAVSRFFDGMFAEGEVDGSARSELSALRGSISPPDRVSALAGLEILAREDLRAALPSIRLPTLLVHGERDPICPAGASRAMAESIPASRLVEIRGAGHAPFLSRAGDVLDACSSFLAEVA